MPYRAVIERQAARYLARQDTRLRMRVEAAIEKALEDPLGSGSKAVVGEPPLRSLRVGGFRIIYAVDEAQELLRVIRFASRGRAYRRGA